MSESIDQMRQRHEDEIEHLRATCEHDRWSSWVARSDVCKEIEQRVCIRCGTKQQRIPLSHGEGDGDE